MYYITKYYLKTEEYLQFCAIFSLSVSIVLSQQKGTKLYKNIEYLTTKCIFVLSYV